MRKTAWYRVTATGLVEGNPVQFGFYKTLTLRNGNRRRCPMVVSVTDEAVLQRLREEVHTGDQIRVCVETDWNAIGIPKVLRDFCRL
jgi:hypothetical protein